MLARLLVAAFLLAHAAIHAGFVSPRPVAKPGAPPWPFDLNRSWVFSRLRVRPQVVGALGLALVAATLGGFALAAVATLGILPASAWDPAVAVGSLASLALLVLFFHAWLVVGVAIDVLLLWVALVAGWSPEVLD